MGAQSTNPYTSQSISGYNSSPPPDDGTQTAANQLSWAKHKTKLADPVKTLAEGINTAVSATFAKTINTDADVANQISGSLALEWATATIGTDAISPTYSAVLLGTESGATSDTLQTITATGVYNGAMLTIRQRNATEEINLIHATSTAATATGPNIYLNNKGRVVLDNAQKSIDLRYDSGTASGWVELGGAGFDANTFTGDQTVAGDVNLTSGALNTARATVASAATTADIWAANGNQIDWTGTVTCTGFPAAPQAGVSRTLICDGAAPFTAGANMEIDGVTSGNTVTCAAKDKMIVEAITTTQFRLSRVKYDGTAMAVTQGLTYLSTTTGAGVATIDVETGFGETYDDYLIVATNITPSVDGVDLFARLKLAGAYQTDALYNYHLNKSTSAAATYSGEAAEGATSIKVAAALDTNGGADSVTEFNMDARNINSSSGNKAIDWKGHTVDANASPWVKRASGAGLYRNGSALTGVRFFATSGNISGTFRLYGVNKS